MGSDLLADKRLAAKRKLAQMKLQQLRATGRTTTVSDPNTGQIVGAPHGMPPEQALYHNDVDNNKKDPSSFFGYVELAADRGLQGLQMATRAIAAPGVAAVTGDVEELEPIRALVDAAATPAKGAAASAASLTTTLISGTSRRRADRMLEELDKDDYSIFEYMGMLPQAMVGDTLPVEIAFKKLTGQEGSLNKMERQAHKMLKGAERLQKNNARFIEQYVPRPDGVAGGFIYDLGGVGTTVAGSIGLSYLTRSPAPAAVLFGKIQQSDVYNAARDAGMDASLARPISSVAGLVEGGIEFIGVSQFMKMSQADKGLSLILKRAMEESIQEGLQEFGSELIQQGTGVKEVDVEGAIKSIAYSMLLGGFGGGGTASVMEAGKYMAEQKGLHPEMIDKLQTKVQENQEAFDDRVGEVMHQEASVGTFKKNKANRQAGKIINQFFTGQDIDVKAALQDAEHMSQTEKNAVFDMINEMEADRTVQQDKARAGRIAKIDNDIRNLDTEISDLSDLVNERNEAGKPVVDLNKQIDKKIEEREDLDEERTDITETGVPASEGGKVEVKPEDVGQSDKGRKANIRTFQKTFRQAQRAWKADGNAARKAVTQAIKQSGLDKKAQAGFLTQISNINTAEDAAKALPKINSRISNLIEKQNRKDVVDALGKQLKSGKKPKAGQRPQGKKMENAEDQLLVDALTEYLGMTQDAANVEMAKVIKPDMTKEQWLQAKVLGMVANPNSVSLEQMTELLEEVEAFVSTSKDARKTKDAERREAIQADQETVSSAVFEGVDRKTRGKADTTTWKGRVADTKEKIAKIAAENASLESGWSNGWYDNIDIVLGKTEEGRKLRDRLAKDVHTALQKGKRLNATWGDKFVQLYADIYSLSSTSRIPGQSQVHRSMIADEKQHVIGEFAREGQEELEDGAEPKEALEPEIWKISKAEMRKLWMELQDPTIRPSLVAREGNGITVEMENIIEDTLSDTDKKFARAQMDLYKEIFPEMQRVYANIYGAFLPSNPFYSPVRGVYDAILDPADEMLQELHTRVTAAPGSTKQRVSGIREIEPQSDVAAMLRHITQAAHFVSMAETSRDLKAIFGNSKVAKDIAEIWGRPMVKTIDAYIEDFTIGESRRAEDVLSAYNWLNSNFSVAVLALKPNLMFKQMTSAITFAADIPMAEYVAGMADFITNFDEAMEIMRGSALMQARGSNQDVAIARGVQQYVRGLRGRTASLSEIMLLPTRLGDRGAIYFGGWSVYRYHRKVLGKSHEEAMAEFEFSVAMSQQSSDLDQKSRVQAHDNLLVRGTTMFMSAPNAYYRASKRAMRQRMRGEISRKEFTKKMTIYNVMLPILFQFVSGAFAWDDEDNEDGWIPFLPKDMERALITGWLDGLFIIGPLWERTIAYKQGIYWPESGPNFLEGITEVMDAAVNEEDGIQMWADIIEGLFLIAGLPNETVFNMAGGVMDITEGETEVGIKRVLGYSEGIAERSSD